MRRAVTSVALAALVLAGTLFVLRGEVPRFGQEAEAHRVESASPIAAVEHSASPPEVVPTPARRQVDAEALAEREELRRRILEARRARERAAAERDGVGEGGSTGGEPSAVTGPRVPVPRDSSGPEEEEPAAGSLIDRTGDHEYLVKVMNEELMPLADECYALARETQPELAGMLVLDFEILGEEGIGGVVESVQLGQANELVDSNLLECMRESILATTLPAPEQGGRDAISISLRLSPEDAE